MVDIEVQHEAASSSPAASPSPRVEETKECLTPQPMRSLTATEIKSSQWFHQSLATTEGHLNTLQALVGTVRELHLARDPDVTPYRSKYRARVALTEALAHYQTLQNSTTLSLTDSAIINIAIANLHYWLGLNYLDTEELYDGERTMAKSLDILSNYSTVFPVPVIDGNNQLSIVFTGRALYGKARDFLLTAQKVYQHCKKVREHCEDNGQYSDGEWQVVENVHTMTLYYLAQVYGKLNRASLSAAYCQLTLNRQLLDGEYDRYEWTVNAMGLALYFIAKNDFQQAHHCLLAAQHHCNESDLPTVGRLNSSDYEPSRWEMVAADLCKTWGHFHLKRLEHHKKTLCNYTEAHADNGEMTMDESGHLIQTKIIFTKLNLPSSSSFALAPSLSFTEAAAVFRQSMQWYQRSLSVYLLDGYVSEHIGIVQDLSQLYALMAHYDTNSDNQSKYVKKRIDLLVPVLAPLNFAHFLELYQQLNDELAHCYRAMLELKRDVKKRNENGTNAIKHFKQWTASFYTGKDNQLALEVENYDSFISAHFHIARLYTKLFADDLQQMLEWHKFALVYYQKVLELGESLAVGDDVCREEISMSREMVVLLPRKMDRFVAHGVFEQ